MNYFKIITILFLILFLANCNPNEEIAPENPCGKYIQPSADFVKEHKVGDGGTTDYDWCYNPDFPFDSLSLPEYRIQFRSEFLDITKYEHTWYVGSEIFTNFKVWRDFSDVKHNTKITISHVLRWKPNLYCNPLETGYDSVSKSFTIVDSLQQMGTFGMYRMIYDTIGAPTNQDSINIELYLGDNKSDSGRLKGVSYKDPFFLGQYTYRLKNVFLNILDKDTLIWKNESYKQRNGNNTGLVRNSFYVQEEIANEQQRAVTPFSGIKIFVLKNNKAVIQYNNYSKQIKLKGRKIN